MEQGNASRFEEYVTLRQEMLELFAFTRQVLYWTIIFLVAGIGWYIGQIPFRETEPIRFPAYGIGLVLFIALRLSSQIYFHYLSAIYRVGSYLAVFWESSNERRALTWHRFNRQSEILYCSPLRQGLRN